MVTRSSTTWPCSLYSRSAPNSDTEPNTRLETTMNELVDADRAAPDDEPPLLLEAVALPLLPLAAAPRLKVGVPVFRVRCFPNKYMAATVARRP